MIIMRIYNFIWSEIPPLDLLLPRLEIGPKIAHHGG